MNPFTTVTTVPDATSAHTLRVLRHCNNAAGSMAEQRDEKTQWRRLERANVTHRNAAENRPLFFFYTAVVRFHITNTFGENGAIKSEETPPPPPLPAPHSHKHGRATHNNFSSRQ